MKILLHRTVLGLAVPCLAGLVVGGPGSSQTEAPSQGKAQKVAGLELVLPLEKLSADNVKRAEGALRDVSHTTFVCPVCRHEEPGPGFCLGCDEDLVVSADPIRPIRKVTTDVQARTARLALAPARELRLSAVEKALKPVGVTLRRNELPILPWSRIELTVTDADDAEALYDAFAALPLDVADVDVDDARNHVSILFGRARGGADATLDEVRNALARAELTYTLVDLVWTGPCRICDRQGATVAACRQCTVRLYEDEG